MNLLEHIVARAKSDKQRIVLPEATEERTLRAIVVSEETGGISVAIKGEFQLRLSAEKLENILSKEMNF